MLHFSDPTHLFITGSFVDQYPEPETLNPEPKLLPFEPEKLGMIAVDGGTLAPLRVPRHSPGFKGPRVVQNFIHQQYHLLWDAWISRLNLQPLTLNP